MFFGKKLSYLALNLTLQATFLEHKYYRAVFDMSFTACQLVQYKCAPRPGYHFWQNEHQCVAEPFQTTQLHPQIFCGGM